MFKCTGSSVGLISFSAAMFDVCSEAYVSLSVIAGTEGIFDNNE